MQITSSTAIATEHDTPESIARDLTELTGVLWKIGEIDITQWPPGARFYRGAKGRWWYQKATNEAWYKIGA